MTTFDDGLALISITLLFVCYDSFMNESKNKSHNKYDSSTEIIGSSLSLLFSRSIRCASQRLLAL